MIVDLNSGGASPFGPALDRPQARNISTLINPHIDRALAASKAAQPKRLYLGASELGDDCKRRVILNALDTARKSLSGRMLRIFEMGHIFEAMVADWLKRAGFELTTLDPRTHQQWEFKTADGRIQGHADGVITGGPNLEASYPLLWENKAIMARYWEAIVKKGVQLAEPKYYYQCQIYMGYFDLQGAVFTSINKNTAEIYSEFIPYSLASAQRISDRGVELIKNLERGELPRRISQNPSHFRCKMCDFQDECWRMAE